MTWRRASTTKLAWHDRAESPWSLTKGGQAVGQTSPLRASRTASKAAETTAVNPSIGVSTPQDVSTNDVCSG